MVGRPGFCSVVDMFVIADGPEGQLSSCRC
jgi:hypothetical protein